MKKIITLAAIVGGLVFGLHFASAGHTGGSYYVIPTYSSYTYSVGCNTYRYDPYYRTSTLISSTCSYNYSYGSGYSNYYPTYSYSYPTYSSSYYYPTYTNSYNYSSYPSNYSPYDNYNYGYNYNYTNYGYYNNSSYYYPYSSSYYYGGSPNYQYWYNYSNGYPTSIQNVPAPILNWNTSSYGNNYNYYPNYWGY